MATTPTPFGFFRKTWLFLAMVSGMLAAVNAFTLFELHKNDTLGHKAKFALFCGGALFFLWLAFHKKRSKAASAPKQKGKVVASDYGGSSGGIPLASVLGPKPSLAEAFSLTGEARNANAAGLFYVGVGIIGGFILLVHLKDVVTGHASSLWNYYALGYGCFLVLGVIVGIIWAACIKD